MKINIMYKVLFSILSTHSSSYLCAMDNDPNQTNENLIARLCSLEPNHPYFEEKQQESSQHNVFMCLEECDNTSKICIFNLKEIPMSFKIKEKKDTDRFNLGKSIVFKGFKTDGTLCFKLEIFKNGNCRLDIPSISGEKAIKLLCNVCHGSEKIATIAKAAKFNYYPENQKFMIMFPNLWGL